MCYRTHTQRICGHTVTTHHHCLACISHLQNISQATGSHYRTECECRRFGRIIVKAFSDDICKNCEWEQIPNILKARTSPPAVSKMKRFSCNFGCGCSGFSIKRKPVPSIGSRQTVLKDKERKDEKYEPYWRAIVHHGVLPQNHSGKEEDETASSCTSGSSSWEWTTPSIHVSPPPELPTSSIFQAAGSLASASSLTTRPHLNITRTSHPPPSQDSPFAALPQHLAVKASFPDIMAPRSSLNIVTTASPSPSPPRPKPPRLPLSPRVPRSTPRKAEPAAHKQPLSTPRPTPGRKVEPASLYLPALRTSASTPSRPSISQPRSFSSASPKDQEVLIEQKIDNTLSQLFSKVDTALSSPSTTNKTGDVPIIRLKVDASSPDPSPSAPTAESTPLCTTLDNSAPWSAMKSSSSPKKELPIIGEQVQAPRPRTPVEDAREIRRGSGWKCCLTSSPKRHTDGCENAQPVREESVAPKPSATATPTKKTVAKTKLRKEQERWMCKAHKTSPPEDDRELYVCMRCTRNRTNKSGTGRRP